MNPKTLVVTLMGGMGNQMFQYAAALRIARKNNVALKVQFRHVGARDFALDVFGIELDSGDYFDVPMIGHGRSYTNGDEAELNREALYAWDKADVIRLCGYFQNEAYFADVADELRSVFAIPPIPISLQARPLVAVNVRRGDFVGHPTHDVCDREYYLSCMRLMRGILPNASFVIVSDDPGWCSANLGEEKWVVVVEHESPFNDMRLLMSCEAFILSNSTFGWWPAWLSKAETVMCPTRYMVPGHDWNIAPSRWIQIPPQGISPLLRR